jgi:folate-binding protein YgfZ
MTAVFSELRSAGLVSVRGPDAQAFLHAQLTSDIAGLGASRTQWSGYCSPKGRLLATFLVWRHDDEFLLQLPESLRASIQSRLARYVLRARVKLENPESRLYGVWGDNARATIANVAGELPSEAHHVSMAEGVRVARLSIDRFVVVASSQRAASVRAMLLSHAREAPESVWSRLDIQAGVPIILPQTQEEYVPQMVNLDAIGGLSYTKGCYPGQEIVARTHYLGRLKQRAYRIHVPVTEPPLPGDPLYSPLFGADQASGAVLYAAPSEKHGYDALAVVQTSAARSGELRLKSIGGPVVELKSLPYTVPDEPSA